MSRKAIPAERAGKGETVTYTKSELSELLHLFLDIGEELNAAGGEVFRVEDTVTRLGRAYGAIRVDVFAITSSLEVTMAFPGDIELTRTRRLGAVRSDFKRLEALNALSRRCCATPMTAAELRQELAAARSHRRPAPLYLGSALAGGAFAIFFGGGLMDGLLGAAFGLLICLLQETLPRLFPNNVLVSFVAALLTGMGVGLFALIPSFIHPDMVMIGDIMLLIPGIALTVAIRNILVGDTISGILRLTESIVVAVALAGGFMVAMSLFDLGYPAPAAHAPWVQLLCGAVGSVGFALIFRLRGAFLPLAALGGLVNWGGYLLLYHLTGALFLSCLLASTLAAVYAELLAKRLHAPTTVFLVPAVIPSIPGSTLYYTMFGVVRGDWQFAGKHALLTAEYALGIAAGMSIVFVLFATYQKLVGRAKERKER